MTTTPNSAKRKRLSTKQIKFLRLVFLNGLTVNEAVGELKIRLTTFDRWLTRPLFVKRLRMHINHYYFEAHMELARSTPEAISCLTFLRQKSFRHQEVRQACNDLLNFHRQYGKFTEIETTRRTKKTKNDAVWDKFEVFLEQFDAVLDSKSAVSDKQHRTKNTKKPHFQHKKQRNRELPPPRSVPEHPRRPHGAKTQPHKNTKKG